MEKDLLILSEADDDIPVKINGEEIGTAYINHMTGDLEMHLDPEAARKLFQPDPLSGAFNVSIATTIHLESSK